MAHDAATKLGAAHGGTRNDWHLPRWARRSLIAGGVFLGLLFALLMWFVIAQPVQVLPRMGPAPQFVLTDQNGAWVSDADLRGKQLLVSIGYTRCASDCAEARTHFQAARTQLHDNGLLGSEVRLLTISIDPAYDQPALLQQAATASGASAEQWLWLTGSPNEIKNVIGGGFGIYYDNTVDPAVTPIKHNQRVLLIDQRGEIRNDYDALTLDPATVLRDVRLVQTEAQSSAAARPIYEAAHLFVCYPR